MKMKKILYFLLLQLPFAASAQQTGNLSHLFYKPSIFNPAYTGETGNTNAFFASRAQWTDFAGAPQLHVFSVDGSFMNQKAGLGLTLFSDRKGITSRIGGNVAYSYLLKINDDLVLRPGISLGVIDHSIDFNQAQLENNSDPLLPGASQHRMALDASAGIMLKWKDLQLGIAVPQLLGTKIKYTDQTDIRTFYAMTQHYMANVKYDIALNASGDMIITPQVICRYVPGAPFQYDGNLNFQIKDKFWIGATYKSNYAVSANAGVVIHKQLAIGYSYDFITNPIGQYAGLTHEIMLSFKFGKKGKEEINPVAETPVVPVVNEANESRLDSLEQELRNNQIQVKRLADELERMKKHAAAQPSPGETNTAVPPAQEKSMLSPGSGFNKTVENGVITIQAKTNEFKDEKNTSPAVGYYVVVGTFHYRDYAEAEARRFLKKGYQTSDVVYYGPYEFNYVFLYKLKTKAEATEKIKEAQKIGVQDAWILSLPE
jgi:type IX secretion system PorP/SprF family membrane protein